jgi:hypothetical protein
MFYAITRNDGGGLSYFTHYLSTWTTNMERAVTFGSKSAADERAKLLSRDWETVIEVREYDGAWIRMAPNKVVSTFTRGKPNA